MSNGTNDFRPSKADIERRYEQVRAAMRAADLDALVVSGSEYTGFEGAVRYMCGFHILHRYAYVVVPVDAEPVCVFPREATWVGNHEETFLEQREFPDHCGNWMADYLKGLNARRVGVYGMNFIMPVRDFRALDDAPFELVEFDEQFDHARAAKSEEEIKSVRNSMEINKAGVVAVMQAYEPGKTEAELMGAAEREFAARGTARKTMDMILTGPHGSIRPQMVFPSFRKVEADDGLLYGLEVAGPGGHWVEFSRMFAPQGLSKETEALMECYQEFFELVKTHLRAGASAEDVHRKVAKPFHDKGYRLGHVTGHSIGMTMIEAPRIGEGSEFELPENATCSMHPHVMSQDRSVCLYMQETFRVGKDGGEPLSGVPMRAFKPSEALG